MPKQALYYIQESGTDLRCVLCPHQCLIHNGKYGNCRVRRNSDGKFVAETYGKLSGLHLDPIEKKPLYHFFPGKLILSVGSAGCNLRCSFCQNWEISQCGIREHENLQIVKPDELVKMALSKQNNIGVAYTYNEPTVFIEYVLETAKLVQEKKMKNVMVSNGYINPEPLNELLRYIDAFNIDLKGFTEKFYHEVSGASLQPVLDTLKTIKMSGKHLEITNLVVPGLNDQHADFEAMVKWISKELGKDIVLHLSRYFPQYKMTSDPTPVSSLQQLFDIARKYLSYVYVGNVTISRGKDTVCPKCGQTLIKRFGFMTDFNHVNSSGQCRYCGNQVLICSN